MDPSNRTLDSMVAIVNPSEITAYDERPVKRRGVTDETIELLDDDAPMRSATADERDRPKEIPESNCDFTSIQEMRRAVKKAASQGELLGRCSKLTAELMETFTKHAFVGVVDRRMCLSLMQHSTRLLLVNHASLG